MGSPTFADFATWVSADEPCTRSAGLTVFHMTEIRNLVIRRRGQGPAGKPLGA